MSKVKYLDVEIGEDKFTCRLERCDYVSSNDMVRAEIYESHSHPRNFLERLIEPFKYISYKTGYWTPYTNNATIKEWIISLCKGIVQCNDERFQANKEWESI